MYMKKHLLAAAIAATFTLSSAGFVLAAPEAQEQGPRFSPEDFAAFADARIAAIKAGLKLTPAQEKNWPALEAVIRDEAKERAARFQQWGEEQAKGGEKAEHRNPIEFLQRRSDRLAARAADLKKLSDSAKPLYDSLDDAQKRRFGPLLRASLGGFRHWGHGEHGGWRQGSAE